MTRSTRWPASPEEEDVPFPVAAEVVGVPVSVANLLSWLASHFADDPGDHAEAAIEVIFGLAPITGAKENGSVALEVAAPSQAKALRAPLRDRS